MGTASEYTLRQLLYLLNGAGVWKQDGVTQILKLGSVAGGVTTLYTVPSDRIGYLTTITMWVINTGAQALSAYVSLASPGPIEECAWAAYAAPGTCANLSISFPVPILMPEGWLVVLVVGSGASGQASITGYELPE